MADGYRGVVGAFPYAFRHTDSWLFRAYVLVGTAVTAVVSLIVLLGLVVVFGKTASVEGGSLTLVRAFYVVVGVLAILPIVAPILLVARRHRRDDPVGVRYDASLAVGGFLFVVALYAGLVISVPECFVLDGEQVCRDPPSGAFAPVVRLLYALPQWASVVPPLATAAAIYAIHRGLSGRSAEASP